MELLEARRAHFRSLAETIETGVPGGLPVFSVFGALAEFERGLIRERTMAGLAAARARGKVGGRPQSNTDKRLKAAEGPLKAGDLTVAEVAQQVGVSPSTLYRYFPAARANAGGMSERP